MKNQIKINERRREFAREFMQLSDYFSNHMLTFLNSWRQHLEISLLALQPKDKIIVTKRFLCNIKVPTYQLSKVEIKFK